MFSGQEGAIELLMHSHLGRCGVEEVLHLIIPILHIVEYTYVAVLVILVIVEPWSGHHHIHSHEGICGSCSHIL